MIPGGAGPINKTHLTLSSASASFAPMILQGGLVMEKLQRRFGAGIGVWLRTAVAEEGRTRGSLAQDLCEAADWRNAKGDLCLASRVLALAAERLPSDWEAAHGVRPLAACTHTWPGHSGACYRAAGWSLAGRISGRRGPKRRIWIRPLVGDWREELGRAPAKMIVCAFAESSL